MAEREALSVLKRKITGLSSRAARASNNWDTIRSEWFFEGMFRSDTGHNCECTCGHKIKYIYVIRNNNNNKQAYVGSECVKHFLGEEGACDMNLAFKGLLEIQSNPRKKANDSLIRFAHSYPSLGPDFALAYATNEDRFTLEQFERRREFNLVILEAIMPGFNRDE